MTNYLYIARLGEQEGAEHGIPDGPLSERGTRQAEALAARLAGVHLDHIWCSPLERGVATANIVAESHGLTPEPTPLLFECVPSGPGEDTPAAYAPFFGSITPEQLDAGRAQMADATDEFLGRHRQDSTDLLITHNPVVSWFVREVLGAPEWKWATLNQAHCGLTVFAQKPGRPWTLVTHNDTAHLTADLVTGLPEGYAIPEFA